MEAIAVRDAAFALHTKASQYKRLLDAVRFLEDELVNVIRNCTAFRN